jgi:chromate transport protein ChrA
MSLIVILASAIFVASTIFLTFGGGLSKMSFYKKNIKQKIVNEIYLNTVR